MCSVKVLRRPPCNLAAIVKSASAHTKPSVRMQHDASMTGVYEPAISKQMPAWSMHASVSKWRLPQWPMPTL